MALENSNHIFAHKGLPYRKLVSPQPEGARYCVAAQCNSHSADYKGAPRTSHNDETLPKAHSRVSLLCTSKFKTF